MSRSILSITMQLAVWAVISWFLIGWTQSCVSSVPAATHSVGTVLQVDGDLVLVSFPVATRELGSQAANWFYIPGHAYQVRDRYPDWDKDPSLQKESDGNR